jgi:hypothetical protein
MSDTPRTEDQPCITNFGALQACRFTPEFGESLDCSESIDLVVVKTLRIVQAAVNKAIKEGAIEIRLNYVNILDVDRNPDGMSGGIRVVGFRNLPDSGERSES